MRNKNCKVSQYNSCADISKFEKKVKKVNKELFKGKYLSTLFSTEYTKEKDREVSHN